VNDKQVYCIILAGGNGTRLWPLSRADRPKQFLSVGSDRSLLDQTIDRVCSLVPKNNIWISTTAKHKASIEQLVGNRIGRIVVEPGLRNTGPALLLNCFEVYRRDPHATIIFMPADTFIPSKDRCVAFLEHVLDYTASHDRITLLGLKPHYPATEYGYIEYDSALEKSTAPFPVATFHEKPTLAVAQRYYQQKNMLWNSGMFCAQVGVFIEEFKKEAPDIFCGVRAYVEGRGQYDQVRAESVDFAVMEKSKRVSVLPVDFAWCDVGTIEAFLLLQQQCGQNKSLVMSVDAQNNLVDVKGKLVALIGVDDLCIVETKDTLLITKKGQAQQVKQIVQQLERLGRKKYL